MRVGKVSRCVLISLHELGMATRDQWDQVLRWLSRKVVAVKRSAIKRQGWQVKSAGGQSSSCSSAWMRAATSWWSEQIHALFLVTSSRAF